MRWSMCSLTDLAIWFRFINERVHVQLYRFIDAAILVQLLKIIDAAFWFRFINEIVHVQHTILEYKYDQLKNKWDKLRGDYSVFKKLKLKETGAGWDIERNTVKQDAEWWKKAKIVSFHSYVVHNISFFSLVVNKYLCCIVGHSRLLQVQEAWTSQ